MPFEADSHVLSVTRKQHTQRRSNHRFSDKEQEHDRFRWLAQQRLLGLESLRVI